MKRISKQKKSFITVVFSFGLIIGLYFISKSRTFQFFGEIYSRINTTQKVVSLTFDDGPSKNVDEILNILKSENVKATFFLNGSSIEKHMDATVKIVETGHEIGNHSYLHNRLLLKSYDSIKEEIEKTDSLIQIAGYNQEIHFRPPYGKKLFMLPYYLKKNNRKTIMWDVEPESNSVRASNPEEMAKYAIENTRPGSIILLHVMFGNKESMEAVNKIILGLKNKGYEFMTISELFNHREK